MGHFSGNSVYSLLSEHGQLLRKSVLGMGEEILLRPPEDTVAEVVDTHRLDVPTLFPDRA